MSEGEICDALGCRAWQLAQHIASTYFMSFWLVVMVGLLLELRSRRCFLMSRKSTRELQWQPSGFAAVLAQAVGTLMRPFCAADPTAQPLPVKHAAAAQCWTPASTGASAASCSASTSAGPSGVSCCSESSSAGQGVEGSAEAGSRSSEDIQAERPAVSGPCGAESVAQIEACQQLLDDRNKLAKQQRSLRYKCATSLLPSTCSRVFPEHAVLTGQKAFKT